MEKFIPKRKIRVFVFGPSGPDEGGGISSSVNQLLFSNTGDFDVIPVNTIRRNRASVVAFFRAFVVALLTASRARFSDEIDVLFHFNISKDGSCIRKLTLSLIARMFSIPHVYLIHSGGFPEFVKSLPPFFFTFLTKAFERANGVGCVSVFVMRQLVEILPSLGGKIVFLPNGSTLSGNYPKKSKSANVEVAFVGPTTLAKGFDLYKELATNLNKLGLDSLRFNVLGASSPEIESTCPANMIFHGHLRHDVAVEVLSRCSYLVITSRVEAMPMVAIESMQLGVPIVSSMVGDMPFLLQQGKLGTLFETGNGESCLAAFLALRDRLADGSDVANRAYESWRISYTAQKMTDRLCGYWSDALVPQAQK